MVALNISFTDEEMDALREAARRESRSLKAVAHDAVVNAVVSRKRLVSAASARVADTSAELNARLADG